MVQVAIVTDYRFFGVQDQGIWTPTIHPYAFWKPYLDVFDQVMVIARVKWVSAPQENWQRSDGQGVSFYPLPYYLGPWQYMQKLWTLRRKLKHTAQGSQALILRVPSQLANTFLPFLQDHPFALEVLGDPYDVFAPNVIQHPLRPFFRWYGVRLLRDLCQKACAVSYVTQNSLQKRYVPGRSTWATTCSDVQIPNECFAAQPRTGKSNASEWNLLTIASMSQTYKGIDLLIAAVGKCMSQGLNLKLVIIGDGIYRQQYEQQAYNLGLDDRIQFKGHLPYGPAIFQELRQADLFVLASRTEGLPKALIEAMAVGLPCLGSEVGGIPELLAPEDLFPPENISALSEKIAEILKNPSHLAQMSQRNLIKANEYRLDRLQQKQQEFYQYIRTVTETWIRRKS